MDGRARTGRESAARVAAWALLSSAAALAAGAVADRVVRLGWRALGAGEPVLRPERRGRWGAALAATAATAAVVAVTEMLAEEALGRAWERATGSRPPRV